MASLTALAHVNVTIWDDQICNISFLKILIVYEVENGKIQWLVRFKVFV